jgi:hypothetical protein
VVGDQSKLLGQSSLALVFAQVGTNQVVGDEQQHDCARRDQAQTDLANQP